NKYDRHMQWRTGLGVSLPFGKWALCAPDEIVIPNLPSSQKKFYISVQTSSVEDAIAKAASHQIHNVPIMDML
ncbi:unnamed protein product, partial [Timema podura]|nr:unnamed protein product [Timema podura]